MSVIEYLKGKSNNLYERLKWELKYSGPAIWIYYPFNWLMHRERGLDFPFYFNEEKRFTERKLAIFIEWMNNFVSLHEPERYAGETSLTLINRLKYVARNLIYYSNDTMSNLYYGSKLPTRDYQRLKHSFFQHYLVFFSYNFSSDILLVALVNYYFRNRRASLPVAFVAAMTTFILFSGNYRLSYSVMDKMFSNHVRRLGYGHLIHEYNTDYPRNVDFLLE
jgi:hypothetical protein